MEQWGPKIFPDGSYVPSKLTNHYIGVFPLLDERESSASYPFGSSINDRLKPPSVLNKSQNIETHTAKNEFPTDSDMPLEKRNDFEDERAGGRSGRGNLDRL